MAVITSSIPRQSFEVIRDQIAAIIGTEMAHQYALDNTYPNINKVTIEKWVPNNAETDFPLINVSVDKGDFSNKNSVKSDGQYVYNIDIYTIANYSDGSTGDTLSMLTMCKIMGMIRYILSVPEYITLGFPRGTIISTHVARFFIGNKENVTDALSSVVGRIQFVVSATESNNSSVAGNALQLITTKGFFQDPTYGFYFQYQP